MPTDDDPYYPDPLSFLSSSFPGGDTTEAQIPKYDFIHFLAVAQKLHIDFLPITCHPALGSVGSGATAQIKQAQINTHTSLAFKYFHEKRIREDSSMTLPINEITVLGHPSIRNHPNVNQLQGISWDLSSDDKVWPVLVFEKSRFGDLSYFARLPAGRDLSTNERLKLCVDIGTAIMDMHSNNIIHGDIKPGNILIFEDSPGTYTARVTDFGYSTQFANKDDLVSVPQSPPWVAPEYSYSRPMASQAVKMDVFSFSMLCLWFLFENYFSGTTPLPERALWAETFFVHAGKSRWSSDVLEDLKEEDKLSLLAQQLLEANNTLDRDKIDTLVQFMSLNLRRDPDKREASLCQSFGLLARHQMYPLTMDPEEKDQHVLDGNFEIISSIRQLYESDHRLAFCYRIGFGVMKSDEMSQYMLQQSKRTKEELESSINQMKDTSSTTGESKMYQATLYSNLQHQGHIGHMHGNTRDQSQRDLEKAERRLKEEIADLILSVGTTTAEVSSLSVTLSSVYSAQGRWKEAEALEMQVMETRLRILGQEHPDTLTSMANLALAFWNRGQWKKTEELIVQIMETRERILGREHPDTLTSISSLASMFKIQGRWKEAEELYLQVVTTSSMVFGGEHSYTLASMANLASALRIQGRWKEAEELEMQVMETRLRILGQEHPDTLTSMANLASTQWNQGKLGSAEELFRLVMQRSQEAFGLEHPSTVTSMANLASTLWSQGRRKEAEMLFVQARKMKTDVMGQHNPFTVAAMANLALIEKF